MFNEVNITEIFYGAIDPGQVLQFFYWNTNYDQIRVKASLFSVLPDPLLPFDGGTIEFEPDQLARKIHEGWRARVQAADLV
jgi:hypothetical protein